MPFLNGLLFAGLWCGGLRPPAVWTVAALILWGMVLRDPPRWKALPLWRVWTAWLAWGLISALFSAEPLRSLAAFARMSSAFLVFPLFYSKLRESGRRQWFFLLCLSGVGLGLAAILIPVPGFPMVGLLYPYYNYTACLEAMVFAACLGALGAGYPADRRGRVAAAGVLVFGFFMIFLAKSRGGVAACAVAALIWLWRKGWGRWIVWSGVAAAGLIVLMPVSKLDPWLKMNLPGAYVRPRIWAASVAVVKDHPMLGIGPGLFERGFQLYNFPVLDGSIRVRYGMRSAHAHSEYLQMAAEMGLPGLILFLLGIGSGLARAWSRKKSSWSQEAALGAAQAALVQALVDNILFLPALLWLFYSCLALASGEAEEEPPLRTDPVWIRRACQVGLACAALAWMPDRAVDRFSNLAFKTRGPSALSWIRSAIRIAPGDAGLWEDLAQFQLKQSPPRPDLALESVSTAERLEPTNAVYPATKAEILGAMGNWGESFLSARKAVRLEPVFVTARLLAARALCLSGKKREALFELKQAELLRSEETMTLSKHGYFGVIMHFDPAKYGEVSELIRKGCKIRPSRAQL